MIAFDQADFDVRCEWGENGDASLSPEAQVTVAAFCSGEANLVRAFKQCSSGKELATMGFEGDIAPTAEVDVDDCAPILKDDAYVRAEPTDRGHS